MRKLVIICLICSIITGCIQKRNCEVIIFRPNPCQENDTIEIKTTSYYPHFVLKAGSEYLEINEPIPITPWKRRIRKIWVGENQEGYRIIKY